MDRQQIRAINDPALTQLQPHQELMFKSWLKANDVPFQDNGSDDYDMRAFFLNNVLGGQGQQRNGQNMHFPDTYKQPSHESYSSESIKGRPSDPKRSWIGEDTLADWTKGDITRSGIVENALRLLGGK